MDINVDLAGEKELCGSFNEEDQHGLKEQLHDEEDSSTDGELSTESESDSEVEDSEIQRCLKNRDINKLKKILKKREDDCK